MAIKKEYKAKRVMEGAGVPVNRVFGYYELNDFDPFLMLDYIDAEPNAMAEGFPWHPHKGIETISYMLKGEVKHEDSIGNKGTIGAGELQWMSSGRGILHQEMPGNNSEGAQGFQFWLNMPAKDKLNKPDYQYIKKGEMKTYNENGVEVKIISGEYKGIRGVIDKRNLGVSMYHVVMEKDSSITFSLQNDKSGFIFVFEGNGTVNNEKIEEFTAYTLEQGELEFHSNEKMQFIFAEGVPLNESVAWRGPVVMNTQEELIQTFSDLQKGTFIKD